MTLTAMFQVYPPVLLSFVERTPLGWMRADATTLRKSMATFLLMALAVFPLAFVINHFYQLWFWSAAFHVSRESAWFVYVITQVLLVAFPEEFFFRGYMQEALARLMPTSTRFWGASFGRPQIIIAAIFALSHSLIQMRWWHAFIFFPALAFGWLKERTGSIWAGVLFHASCNLFSYWVYLHYGQQ